jgi:STE24 endopeptidase
MAVVGSLSFLVAAILLASLQLWLTHPHMRHVAARRAAVPAAFAAQVPLNAHQRAADYTFAKGGVEVLEIAVQAGLLPGWTLLVGLALLSGVVRIWVPPEWVSLTGQVALLAAFAAVGTLLDLPFAVWRTFGLVQRFGFNRTTPALFAADLK